jgi:hypothetical protein
MCEIAAEHAAEHADRVMVRVERQGKDLLRDDAALKRLIDKKPSKKEVENVAARAKEANEANEELRKKPEDVRLGGDEMGEAGDAVRLLLKLLDLGLQSLVVLDEGFELPQNLDRYLLK